MMETLGHLPMGWLLFTFLAATGFGAFFMGRTKLVAVSQSNSAVINGTHSQPNYHGYFVAMVTLLPAALIFLVFFVFGDSFVRSEISSEFPDYILDLPPIQITQYLDRLSDHSSMRVPPPTGNVLFDQASIRMAQLRGEVRFLTLLLALLVASSAYTWAIRRIDPAFRARRYVEEGAKIGLFMCAAIAVLTTAGIVLSLVFETVLFLTAEDGPSVWGFLFGTEWNAQTGEDFGAVPLFFGTFMIAMLAMAVAAPIGLFSAVYLSEYASPTLRAWAKPILELLAGIPTVVYGFFAALTIAPAVRSSAQWINNLDFVPDGFLAAQPQSAMAAGLVMGIMIIPFVSSLSDDVINAVPQSLRDGALAMGATRSETIQQVVLPAALPGVIAALLLAVSRAIGETMIVVMAAGQRAQITPDPTSDLTTITAQIVALLTGDTEFDSAKTLSAFALGFVLFMVTLVFNLIALNVVNRYQEKYD